MFWKAAAPGINLQSRQHPSIKFAVRHSEIVFQMKQARKEQKLGGTEKEGNPRTAVKHLWWLSLTPTHYAILRCSPEANHTIHHTANPQRSLYNTY